MYYPTHDMDVWILKQIISIHLQLLIMDYVLLKYIGCMDSLYLEYDPLANTTTTVNGQDINCETLRIDGCNNSNYLTVL